MNKIRFKAILRLAFYPPFANNAELRSVWKKEQKVWR